jgi:hypothetical protein
MAADTLSEPNSKRSIKGQGMLKLAVSAGALAIGGGLAAALAHADEYNYLSELDHAGVYYASIDDVIDVGKEACRSIRIGNSVDATLSMVSRAGYTPMDTVFIVGTAVYTICRDMQPPVVAWARAHGVNIG